MKFSIYQEKIFEVLIKTNKNIVVQATAGAGKTTTILECLKFVPKFKRTIFLSFSNAIVKELKSRVPVGVQASTLHSKGYQLLIKHFGDDVKKIEEDKFFKKALFTFYKDKEKKEKEDFKNCYRIQDICSFVRMSLTPLEFEKVKDICEYYNIDYTDELLKQSIQLLEEKETFRGGIDFVDMLYLPVKLDIVDTKYDYIFLDEAQDLNECQCQFIMKLKSERGGRLVAVGDQNQCIYGFMGSSVEIFNKLQQLPNTETLTLPVSYRCGKKIVQEAKRTSTLILPFEGNHEGVVRGGNFDEIEQGDIILSRITRPLIYLYFLLLDEGKKSTIVGKDIEKGLVNLAKRCESSTYAGLLYNFQQEQNRLKDELIALGYRNLLQHQRYIELDEKIQVLMLIVKKCPDVSRLVDKIKEIFAESTNSIRLMTIHKSKGLENERVFLITRYQGEKLLPNKHAQKDWEHLQENNLEFVAYTRAKNELVFLDIE